MRALFSTFIALQPSFKVAADTLLRQLKTDAMKKAREDKENEKQQTRAPQYCLAVPTGAGGKAKPSLEYVMKQLYL